MATRLEEILIRVRDTLSDPNAERWTDARLIRLADEAQTSVALSTGSLRSITAVGLATSLATYALPAHAYQITRVLNELQVHVPLISHDQADSKLGLNWQQTTGSPVQFIIYDKLQGEQLKVYPTPKLVVPASLTVYHTSKPAPLLTALSPINISSAFDKALKLYMTGMALRDDKDVQNRQIGNEELSLFAIELRQVLADSALDSTAAGTNYEVSYDRVI